MIKDVKLDTRAAVLIILGVLVPVGVFFGSLWQNHPDPSNVSPGELLELTVVISPGRMVFECEETGELLPTYMAPIDLEDRYAYNEFFHEHAFRHGRVEIRTVYLMLVGVVFLAAGVVLARIRGGKPATGEKKSCPCADEEDSSEKQGPG